jgi:hypothetical protein
MRTILKMNSVVSALERCGLDKYVKDKNGKFHSFLFWNIIAGLGHLGNAAFSFDGASKQGRTNMYPVFQDYAGWRNKADFCANNTGEIGYTRGDYVILPTESAKSQELSLFWLIVSFHLLSFGFQIVLNTEYLRDYYVKSVLTNGVNPFRFVEYSISASIMVVCLALISNILNLYALIALGCLTAVTQLFGLLAECLFSDQFLVDVPSYDEEISGDLFKKATFRQSEVMGVRKVRKPEKPRKKTPLSVTLRRLGWVAHFSGWISMISAYVGILVQQYFFSVDQNKGNDVSPPSWVTVLIIILAILYNIFGFTQLIQLCFKDPYLNAWTGKQEQCRCAGVTSDGSGDGKRIKCCGRSLNESIELCYVLNSLISKSVLGWTIIGQLLVEDFVVTTTVSC